MAATVLWSSARGRPFEAELPSLAAFVCWLVRRDIDLVDELGAELSDGAERRLIGRIRCEDHRHVVTTCEGLERSAGLVSVAMASVLLPYSKADVPCGIQEMMRFSDAKIDMSELGAAWTDDEEMIARDEPLGGISRKDRYEA